jgi:hypothetical protein
MALLPGSPAIDAGDPNFNPNSFNPPLTTDQRGLARVALGKTATGAARVDVGAYELLAVPTFTTNALTSRGPIADLATATGASPGNGVFSGENVSLSTGKYGFDPTGLAFATVVTVTYTLADGAGVTNSATFTITVGEAPSLVVTTNSDVVASDGVTGLREALAYAATLSGAQAIKFNGDPSVGSVASGAGIVNFYDGAAHTIALGGTEFAVASSVTISAPGENALTISGNHASRVFSVASGVTAAVSGVTLSAGVAGGFNGGGAIYNNGILTLTHCTLSGHTATNNGYGGAIFNAGTLTIGSSTLSGNTADGGGHGGGLYSHSGTVAISSSSIAGNTAGGGGSGGGIFNAANSTLTLLNSTVSGNAATGGNGSINEGGGIFSLGTLALINSTIANNAASGGTGSIDQGGGIIRAGGAMTLANCTVCGNSASLGTGGIAVGGGIYSNADLLPIVGNTIIAGNTAANGPDLVNPFTSQGHNLIGQIDSGSGFTDGVNGDQVGTTASPLDPKLGPLQNNGGPTQTMAPLPASPAIDAGDPNFDPNAFTPPLTTDQRGSAYPRRADSADADTLPIVDIGAFEVQASIENIADQSTSEDTPLSFSFNVGNGPLISSVTGVSSNQTLLPDSNIQITGSGSTRTIQLTPAADACTARDGTATVTVTVTTLDGSTASVSFVLTVNAVADTPSVTNASTMEDTQTTTGLTISRNAADGSEVSHFKITNIQHGTVFASDGTTPFGEGSFVTAAIAGAGLKFTPAPNFNGTSSFDVQASTSALDSGLGGGVVTASITVAAVNDPPSFTKGAAQNVLINAGAQTVSNWATNLTAGPADETGQTLNFIVTNDNNALFTAQPAISSTGTLTYTPAADAFGAATVRVALHDSGGGDDTSAGQTFTIAVHLAAPLSAKILAPGDPVPSQGQVDTGVPGDAVVANFGVPCVDELGNVSFLMDWTSPAEGKGSGLFHNGIALAVVTGPAATTIFKSLGDPVGSADHVAFLATLAGVAKAKATAVVSTVSGPAQVIAQAGDAAPDAAGAPLADGAKFKKFKSIAVAESYVAVFAQLTGPAASDLGLWVKDGSDPLKLALREGQTVAPGKKIKTLVSFAPGHGSPGCGRGWLINTTPQAGAQVMALAFFEDTTQGIVVADLSDLAHPSVRSLSKTPGVTGPFVAGQTNPTFASYGPPARNETTTAFRAALTPNKANVVTAANASGIFVGPTPGGFYAALARVGDDAGTTGAKFSLVKDPVLAADGTLVFPATLRATPAVEGLATTTLWWVPAGKTFGLLAQAGANTSTVATDLPAGVQWSSFTSLAVASGRGPIFAATLAPKRDVVTPANASGVWAMDFNGSLRTLFRTGVTQIDVGAPGTPALKTLKSFKLLNATVGSTGVTRSFNDEGEVVWLATFTDRTTAIIRTFIP